ncbi:transcription factor Tfb4-domain-containing protein [Crepidotus variabilis]|uniref:General transcription and DNA repair factor IIH subunit TFB4 n=1 Tax=Crepidotus variabilis TaxID=179855 RepID=A0A9P6EHQ8_9AGAR|nr:transcription factor Tfb4-domain-containing protein [Crepidotus variabilis]
MDNSSHLSVVLDLSPAQWYQSPLSLDSFLAQLLVFLNAHIALKHDNSLAVFGALPDKSVMLYASSEPPMDTPATSDPNCYPPFKRLDSAVTARISEQLEDPLLDVTTPSAIVGALTKALCYINRLSVATGLVDPRILILSVSPDLSNAYIPIMNSIFSAQKLKVTIDAGQIYGPDTVFLQQAAHLTGGSYLHLTETSALLQYLIMTFLPPPSIRKVIAVPTQDKIDFRAACFCHKNIVDIGFVCSVCLSIFCQPTPVCSTCRTKFPIKTLQRLNASRPLTISSANNSARPTPVSTPRSAATAARHPPMSAESIQNGSGTSAVANGSGH